MQVSEHVHAIKIPFQVNLPSGRAVDRFVYAYVIAAEKVVLMDSGVASSEKTIFDCLGKISRVPEEISTLILTHSHPDHLGAAQTIQRASGCVVAAHPAERAWIEDVELQARERPVPGFHSLVEGPVQVGQTLEDGDTLDLGAGLTLEIFHTPGHSKGSLSLWLREEAALFSGDVIPLPGDMPIYEDAVAAARSIQRLKGLSGVRVLLSSWDDPQEGERIHQRMDEGLAYLQRIHEVVLQTAQDDPAPDWGELSGRVLAELGLPPALANPLIARSFESHWRARHLPDLLVAGKR